MQIEWQLEDAIKRFENISLPEKLKIPEILKDLFLPELIGIDVTENRIDNIKFYYVPVKNKRSELLWKNRTLKKALFGSVDNRCELSPIMDETIQLFDFSIPCYGRDNISERIIFKCDDDLDNSTREEIILNCIRATDYHKTISDTKRICSLIRQNVNTKKYPLNLFGFDIDLDNRVMNQFKTYFSFLQFKSDTSYKGIRVDEQALTSCREIIHFFGLDFEEEFLSIYEKLIQEGAFLDFIGVNYTTELSRSFKTYFKIDKAQKIGKKRGFDLKKVCESENDQAVIEEIRIVMEKFQYIPAIVGIHINENVTFDTKLYFEKMT